MLEIIAAFLSGFLAYPVCIYLVFPVIKKSLKQKWIREEENGGEDVEVKKKAGRPKGSKNKPKVKE
jgi:hypothetical protein